MKMNLVLTKSSTLNTARRTSALLALVALSLLGLGTTFAQNNLETDNFDNNPTLTGWATSACPDYPASFTFVTDMYGGKALRMTATDVSARMYANATTNLYPLQDTARVILWMTNQTYSTNFYVAVDLVDWNSSPDRSTDDPVIGLIAHGTNVVRSTIFEPGALG